MSKTGNRVAMALALGLAAVGVTLGVRAIWSPSARPEQVAAPLADEPVLLPQFSLPLQPEFETQVTAENLSGVAAELRDRARAAIRDNAEVSGLGTDATEKLLASIEEQSYIYLGGSFDARLAFLARTGARYPMLDDARASGDPEQVREVEDKLRAFWAAVTAPIAMHPISLEEVKVRARYLDGRPIRSEDDRFAKAVNISPDRWPTLAGDPEIVPYTIVEWMVPVFYVMPPDLQGPAYFAIWFVWDSGARDWKIHQTRIYSPLRQSFVVVPSM